MELSRIYLAVTDIFSSMYYIVYFNNLISAGRLTSTWNMFKIFSLNPSKNLYDCNISWKCKVMNKNVNSDMIWTHCSIYQKHFQLVPLHKSKPQCTAVLGLQQTSELPQPLRLIFQKQLKLDCVSKYSTNKVKFGSILVWKKREKCLKNKQIFECCLKNNQLT